MKKYWDAFISLFYPRVCEGCHFPLLSQEELLCLHCYRRLPRTKYHFEKSNLLVSKFVGIASITNAFAFLKFNKKGVAQNLLFKLKYQNAPHIGVVLGRWLGQEIKKNSAELYDFIIPVPLHKMRQRKRGYNQAERIAFGLSEVLDANVELDQVIRLKDSKTQTKKGRADRWIELENLYKVRKKNRIAGQRILVVDDVVTTGATIAGVANLLMQNGAKSVSIACIATGK
ncbi:MAG: ComF family protein [Reichenbachiella sp.]